MSHTTTLEKRRHRRRTLSVVSIGSAAKIILAVQATSISTPRGAATGAFTITGRALDALHSLALDPEESTDPEGDNNDEDPTQTLPHDLGYPGHKTIPSISRTASFDSDGAYVGPVGQQRDKGKLKAKRRVLPRIPNEFVAEPSKARHHRSFSYSTGANLAGIHPVLETLEQGSRIGTGQIACAGCAKQGTNFPRCIQCSKLWCSRQCRTGPSHSCRPRRSTIQ